MNSLYQRKFDVDYFEKNTYCWRILSHLVDDAHDIIADIIISVPDMVIKNASIKFNRYLLKECLAIESKASQLKGIDIQKEYREKVYKIFMGMEGCPNITNLLGIVVPGFMYTYYPHLVKTGKMKEENLVSFFTTKYPDDCLAHILFNKKDKKTNTLEGGLK